MHSIRFLQREPSEPNMKIYIKSDKGIYCKIEIHMVQLPFFQGRMQPHCFSPPIPTPFVFFTSRQILSTSNPNMFSFSPEGLSWKYLWRFHIIENQPPSPNLDPIDFFSFTYAKIIRVAPRETSAQGNLIKGSPSSHAFLGYL